MKFVKKSNRLTIIQKKTDNYGSENEYSFKGIIGGIDCLLTDISTLTKAPNKFIALSTYIR